MKKNLIYLSIIFITLISGCKDNDDTPVDINLNDQQKAAVSLRGRWGIPEDISMPAGTTPTVLDDLVLVFRITDQYTPSDFRAEGAEYFFATTPTSKWEWTDNTINSVKLLNTLPTGSVSVIKEGSKIRLTFTYIGEEGGRMGGVGEYSVTLTKVQP
ncbi:hypothetical protein BH23BAC1_BH23BAC1_09760 [soil metagenome]